MIQNSTLYYLLLLFIAAPVLKGSDASSIEESIPSEPTFSFKLTEESAEEAPTCETATSETLASAKTKSAATPIIPVENYFGFWRTLDADGNPYYINLKRGGRASRFWASDPDNAIAQGSWQIVGQAIHIRWAADYPIDVLVEGPTDLQKLDLYNPVNEEDQEKFTPPIPVTMVEQNEVGKWVTRPRTAPKPLPTHRAEDYYGAWKVQTPEGKEFHILIEPNGKAANTLSENRLTPNGARGRWEDTGKGISITWNTKQRDIIHRTDEHNFERISYTTPGPDNPNPRFSCAAIQANADELGSWLEDYRVEQKNLHVKKQKQLTKRKAIKALRGYWETTEALNANPIYLYLDNRDRVHITGKRWEEIQKRGDIGEWRTVSNSAVITWETGHRDILRRTPEGRFELISFPKGEPLMGEPEQTYSLQESTREIFREQVKHSEAKS